MGEASQERIPALRNPTRSIVLSSSSTESACSLRSSSEHRRLQSVCLCHWLPPLVSHVIITRNNSIETLFRSSKERVTCTYGKTSKLQKPGLFQPLQLEELRFEQQPVNFPASLIFTKCVTRCIFSNRVEILVFLAETQSMSLLHPSKGSRESVLQGTRSTQQKHPVLAFRKANVLPPPREIPK